MTSVSLLLSVAKAELGYIEKASNAQLEDKTANPGDKNWTKYARDLDKLGVYNGKKNGYNWCDVFVDWCFVQTFGMDTALKMTFQPKGGLGAGCRYSAQYYQNHGRFYSVPEPGDQIFFGTKKAGKVTSWAHTGIVTKVTSSRVYTIEGNTSKAAGMVSNGGCVREKSYARSYGRILGYGRPNWSLAEQKPAEEMEEMHMTQEAFNQMFVTAMGWYEGMLAEEPVSKWALADWDRARETGLLDGTRPLAGVTRQELAVVLTRLGAPERDKGGKA